VEGRLLSAAVEPPRLLGLGDNTIDTYVSAGQQFPGGNAVNVAVMARRLGIRASYLGCWGDDEGGRILDEALAAEGVDLSHVRRIPGGETARARIAHENGDRRFVGARPGVRANYALRDVDLAFVATHDLVHTSCNSDLDGELGRIAAVARRLSYDYSEKWTEERLAATLPHVHIAFLSAPRRSDVDCEALLARCIEAGVRIAVATRGADSVIARGDGSLFRQPVAAITPIDTLGAGDGFVAGFLVAHLRGTELPSCLAAGAAYAAKVCTWQGAFGHARPWSEPA
jgi:fructoselysine 6-kinase